MTGPTGGAAGVLLAVALGAGSLLSCGAPTRAQPDPTYLPLPASDYVLVGNVYVQTRWITHVTAEADGEYVVNWRIGSGYGARRTATERERATVRAALGTGPIGEAGR